MITPELKDLVLNNFVETGIHITQNIHDSVSDFNVESDVLELIIDQFERMNLIKVDRMIGGLMFIHLTADAFDLQRMGGFVGREKVIRATVEKLSLEVASLKKTFPEKANTFTTIIANLATISSFFLAK